MKKTSKRSMALLLTSALLVGFLPAETGVKSRAVEQSALKNPQMLKTVQEVAPDSGGKKEPENPTTENGITTWDCIWFGNYWQEDTNRDGKADKNDEKTPIKWRVLWVEGDDAFLVADKNLDVQIYNDTDTSEDVTWETCTMRSWLNGYEADRNKAGRDYSGNNFLNNAFSVGEQLAIKTTNVVNNNNPEYGTEGGNDTSDKVYLLSMSEVANPAYGFSAHRNESGTRVAVNTAYTAGGGETGSKYMKGVGSGEYWWLRSPGYSNLDASYVTFLGNANVVGVYADLLAVRPALHLNLSSASGWSYAGTVSSDDVAEWDCIWFGNYWQEDTNGDGKADKNDTKIPIKWRVLSVEGNDAFLVADKNLDVQRYHAIDIDTVSSTDVTWETCTMRSWLNGYGEERNKEGIDYSNNNFLNNAFSLDEQSAIKTTNVINDDNPMYGTQGGNNTSDKVYLLSIGEVMNPTYGFPAHSNVSGTRVAVNTAYTAEGGEIGCEDMEDVGNGEYWWLRSSGIDNNCASSLLFVGNVSADGYQVGMYEHAVRPALHLNLSFHSSWSYAGSMTSKREEIETPTPDATAPPTSAVTASPTLNVTASPKPTSKPIITESPKSIDEPNTSTTHSPLVGTVLEDNRNNVSYKVLTQDKTVAFYQVKNKKATKIAIPSTVTMNGTVYKVTAISNNAFSGCKKLKSVTISKSVTTIGNKAFFKCISLKKMTLPASIIKIGKKAFYGCKKLKSITIKSKKLKSNSVGTQAFKAINKKAVIKVPKKQKKEYEKWLKKKGITKKMKIK